jgi:2-C-methyl-D-erythritol 4-phosphate cytidylyltransferase / 2-C-methyl-D-erythritol 2,4-cyclodiphosphate synthase
VTAPLKARRFWAVVPAAGRGERFDAAPGAAAPGAAAPGASRLPKQYAPLAGATVLEWSLRPLLREPRIERVVVVVAGDDARWGERAPDSGKLLTAIGGASRQESVLAGLKALRDQAAPEDWVLVHDAARPCLESADVAALIAALEAGASGAVLAAPVVDTVKRERDGTIAETVDRSGLWRALTPQAFALGALERALEEAARAHVAVTDEAQAMERKGVRAVLVQGSPFNIKVTRAADLAAAARILQSAENRAMSGKMRIGQGVDVHTFGMGDHVVLGGVRIAHDRGVIAHSDGDVVIHALCDALLGALGKGDIGRHFPDTDARYRGADSRLFLRTVAAMVREAGFGLVNADVTVLAEAPRIAAHRGAMAANLAADLGVAPELINIKATTTERMGFVGRGEGLAAQAAVLLETT